MRFSIRLRALIPFLIICGLLIPMTHQMIPGASEDLKTFRALRAGAGVDAMAKAVSVVADERTTGGKRRTTTMWFCPVYEFTNAKGLPEKLTQRIKCSEQEAPVSSFPEVPVIYSPDGSYYGSFWNSEETLKELGTTSGNYILWFYGSIAAFALTLAGMIWIIVLRIQRKQAVATVPPMPAKIL